MWSFPYDGSFQRTVVAQSGKEAGPLLYKPHGVSQICKMQDNLCLGFHGVPPAWQKAEPLLYKLYGLAKGQNLFGVCLTAFHCLAKLQQRPQAPGQHNDNFPHTGFCVYVSAAPDVSTGTFPCTCLGGPPVRGLVALVDSLYIFLPNYRVWQNFDMTMIECEQRGVWLSITQFTCQIHLDCRMQILVVASVEIWDKWTEVWKLLADTDWVVEFNLCYYYGYYGKYKQ